MAERCGAVWPRTARGFTYLGLMFVLAVMGLLAAAAGNLWRFESQRDRERELIFVLNEYGRALACYREGHTAAAKTAPTSLEPLLGETVNVGIRRCLRRLYPDPITRQMDWVLLRSPAGGIIGLHSRSTLAPIRTRSAEAAGVLNAAGAKTYEDWVTQFSGVVPNLPVAVPTPAAPVALRPDAGEPPGWNYEENGAPPVRGKLPGPGE
jgi:type II secretory pathway pseudopilin PulG